MHSPRDSDGYTSVFKHGRWITPEKQHETYIKYNADQDRDARIEMYQHENRIRQNLARKFGNDKFGKITAIIILLLIPIILIIIGMSGYMDYAHRDGQQLRTKSTLFSPNFVIGFVTPIISIALLFVCLG